MIFAHLPAGYVVARLLRQRLASAGVSWKPFLLACLLGAIAPDLDFLYYYTIDQQQHHHHAYITHFPIFWGVLLAVAGVWYRLARNKMVAALVLAFTFNACVHLCLDSIAGSIRWLAPFSFEPYSLFIVPRVTGSRRLDYLLHWTSWLELIPIAWALWLWRRAR
ncbi:MAG: metal-dependent hydrolase [Burkholderiaceae bacterium]|nr:metal-dependent hydrolase [Burkholderiaceae bacterium]